MEYNIEKNIKIFNFNINDESKGKINFNVKIFIIFLRYNLII